MRKKRDRGFLVARSSFVRSQSKAVLVQQRQAAARIAERRRRLMEMHEVVTMGEAARILGCSRELIRDDCTALGIRCLDPGPKPGRAPRPTLADDEAGAVEFKARMALWRSP